MKRIVVCMTLLLSINISSQLWASSEPKCPSVEAIKKSQFNVVKPGLSESSWTVMQQNNKYDTNITWDFYVNIFEAANENIALKMATEELQSLYFYGGPFGENNTWSCQYANGSNNVLIAISPTGAIPIRNAHMK